MTEGRTSLKCLPPPHYSICVAYFLPAKESNKIIALVLYIYCYRTIFNVSYIKDVRQEMGRIHGTVNGKKCKVMKMAKKSLEILMIFEETCGKW